MSGFDDEDEATRVAVAPSEIMAPPMRPRSPSIAPPLPPRARVPSLPPPPAAAPPLPPRAAAPRAPARAVTASASSYDETVAPIRGRAASSVGLDDAPRPMRPRAPSMGGYDASPPARAPSVPPPAPRARAVSSAEFVAQQFAPEPLPPVQSFAPSSAFVPPAPRGPHVVAQPSPAPAPAPGALPAALVVPVTKQTPAWAIAYLVFCFVMALIGALLLSQQAALLGHY